MIVLLVGTGLLLVSVCGNLVLSLGLLTRPILRMSVPVLVRVVLRCSVVVVPLLVVLHRCITRLLELLLVSPI